MKDNKSDRPKWFKIGDKLCWPLIGMGLKSLDEYSVLPIDLQPLGYNALCHHAGCLQANLMANEKGKYSAAICLVRQSIEALTIAEIAIRAAKTLASKHVTSACWTLPSSRATYGLSRISLISKSS